MNAKHQTFLEKYFAEKNRGKQLGMLKTFMLSLSAEELLEFILEPLRFFHQAIDENKLSPTQKKRLFRKLDDMVALLELKAPVALAV